MNRIFAAVALVVGWLGRVAIAAMGILIVVVVCARFARVPVVGSVDLVKHLMIVVVALGIAYAQYTEAHISIGLLVDRFPRRVQSFLEFVGFVLATLVAGLFSYVFVKSAFFFGSNQLISTGLVSFPPWIFKSVLALGFGFWSLFSLVSAGRSLRRAALRDEPDEGVSI